MNAPHICKLCKDCLTGIGHGANGVNKTPPFLYFSIAKGVTKTIADEIWPIADEIWPSADEIWPSG